MIDLRDDTAVVQETLLEISGQKTVPNVFIHKMHIGGASDLIKLHDEGNLVGLIQNGHITALQNVKEFVDTAIDSNIVIIFGKTFCPFTRKARHLLDSLKVNYEVIMVNLREDMTTIQEYLLEKTGQKGVPNISIHKFHIGGASDLIKLNTDGLLLGLINKGTIDAVPNVEEFVEQTITKHNVVIWGKTFCPFTRKARELLDSIKESYEVVMLDLREDGVQIQNYLHSKTGQK
ncbi:hypothetical protein HDV02_006707, partial [Globomyces sp. JEL0801]